MESKQLKGHGYVRKSKAAGLVCGIVLGAALFAGANSASADEVTATPASAAAAESSAPKAQDSAVTVDEGLTDAANKAKEAGLTVEQEATKDLGTATTEQEAQKLEEEAKKDVAAQKSEIEKKTSDYAAAMKESEVNRKKLIDNLSENPGLYNMAGDQLRALADKDYDAGKASFGEFKSSNGTVRFLDAPNRVDTGKIDPTVELLNSKVISSPKEITSYYAGASMLGANSFVSDKQNVKVVPMLVNDGETITYKVNYASDSKLGQLGVGYVEKSYTLKGSPVQSGKIALLADRYGTIVENYVYGGLGDASSVIKPGQWGFTSSWTYYDKNGKKIDSKELAAKFVNKYWYPGLDLKATDIKLAPTTENKPETKLNGDGSGTKDVSYSFVNGGDSFFTSTRMYEELARAKNVIDPTAQRMSMSGAEVEPVVDTIVKIPTKQTVKYHLVSYKKSVKKTELPGDNATGSVTVEHVTDKGEVLQATKDVVKNGKVGSDYTTEAGKFDTKETVNEGGKVIERSTTYKLVETPANAKGKVTEGTTHVKYVYTKSVTDKDVTPKAVEKYGSVTVEHVTDKGEVLQATKDVVKNGKVGSDYTTEAGKFDTKETVNEGGKVIERSTTYKLVETPANAKGKVTEGTTHVKYVYTKSVTDKDVTPKAVEKYGSVTVEHVTDKGEVLQATKDVVKNGKVGSDYTTEAGHFEKTEVVEEGGKVIKRTTNYKLVETPANAKGKVVEGTTHVKYVYTKSVTDKDVTPKPTPLPVNDPTTIHIDRDGKEIAPKEKGTKGFKKIPGYEADPTSLLNKEDPKGQSVRVYRKVEPKVDPKENPVTIHIDRDGKEIAPKEDGTKGFKEIPGYEKYPEDPKNVENVGGITVRVYKKLEEKPVQPTTPVEPAQPSPAVATQKLNALPETGTATSILSVVGAALGGLGVVGLKSKKDEE